MRDVTLRISGGERHVFLSVVSLEFLRILRMAVENRYFDHGLFLSLWCEIARHFSAPWSPETLARALNFDPDHTVLNMIVDQPHSLHEGIHRGGTDEFPAQLFQILRQSKRFRRGRGSLRFRKLLHVGFVTPDESCQRAFPFDEFPGQSRIVDDRLDLATVANNPFVLEQTREVALGVACYPIEIEIMKGGAEVVALAQDGAPAQSGLKTLQT